MSVEITHETQTLNDEFLLRCGGLKGELVAFAEHNRFGRAFRQLMKEQRPPRSAMDEYVAVNMLDHFALQHRLHDGSTVLERFVAQHRKLTDDERTMLLGWQDVVYGVFEVQQHTHGAVDTVNLVDDMPYRIYSNSGRHFMDQVDDGMFLITRVVPARQAWLISGAVSSQPAHNRKVVCEVAADLSLRSPEAVFRNPARLELAWEIQRDERRMFIEHFGSDLVVLPVADLPERMDAFMRYRTDTVRGEDSIGESVEPSRGSGPPHMSFELPEFDDVHTTVAAIYDELEGLMYWCDFDVVERAFADPELASDERHRDAVLHYLEDDSVSPLAIRRLADRDPEAASIVFRSLLKRPEFEWERDGESLLRQYKQEHFDLPARPCVTVLSDALANVLRDRAAPG